MPARIKRAAPYSQNKTSRCVEWLKKTLSDNGPMLRADVMALAAEQGYPERTVQEAKLRLPILCARNGFHGPTTWSLLPDETND